MADKTEKTTQKSKGKKDVKSDKSKGKPGFDPKAVHVGGESLMDRIYPHRVKIAAMIGGGLVLWGIIAIVVHVKTSHEEAATAKLAAVLDIGRKPVAEQPEPTGSAAGSAGSAGSAAEGSAAVNPDEIASYPARANELLDAIAKQGTTLAGPVYRGSLLIQAGKLDDAIAELTRAKSETGLDGVLAREALGVALEQKALEPKTSADDRQKGLEDALAEFTAMQPDPNGPRRAYALYHQGLVLLHLHKLADANAVFDKAKEAAKESPEIAALVDRARQAFGS